MTHIFLILYSGPYLSHLFLGQKLTAPHPAAGGTEHGLYPDLVVVPTGWTWLTVWRGHPCIYNFITSIHSSGSLFTWSASTWQPTWAILLFTPLEHPVTEISDWRFSQRSICNSGSFTPSWKRCLRGALKTRQWMRNEGFFFSCFFSWLICAASGLLLSLTELVWGREI